MKELNKKLVYLLIAVFPISSCTDTITLDPISQISNSSFWKTENDATAGLNGMYVKLREPTQGIFGILFLNGDVRSNVMELGGGAAGIEQRWYANTLDQTVTENNWQKFYQAMHTTNLILKYVPGMKFNSEDSKNNILAQAHATRAYLYFTMLKTWGDLPLVTDPIENTDPDILYKERTPVAEIFTFIKNEIDEALTLFPNNNFPTGRCFWSKPAVNALKADVYLWTAKRLNGGQSDFNVALNALNEVETSDVALLGNFADVFTYTNKGNKEIIMALNFKVDEASNSAYEGMYMYPGNTPQNTDAATKALIGTEGGYNRMVVTQAVRNQFASDDSRKKTSFVEIYSYDASGIATFNSSVLLKFKGTVISGTRYFVDDYILYRYSDILLMKAETKNALGQDPTNEINKVRLRAYGTNYSAHVFVNGSKESNDETILKERLLELLCEGKYWWDLVRFGKAFELVPSLKDKAGQDYLLLSPISLTTLSLEPKIKQNPGYDY